MDMNLRLTGNRTSKIFSFLLH